MDSWSEIQLRKMDSGGNENLNKFLSKYGISKEMDIVSKYYTNVASGYGEKIQALAEGKSWCDPPMYEDEDKDMVILATDSYLVAVVENIKLAGWKGSLGAGTPWVMCRQTDAPENIVPSCLLDYNTFT
ncbi:hypothetical protein E3N88_44817 [Mikania micrantha]|uniref:Uncharacterized protein n=1 Tax=Mikania micrantha TaxID=192012 RepID=A0A5N6LB74_9ASTR|nr:hypothetical protein E3N88_44817 [Mikania micrantha]